MKGKLDRLQKFLEMEFIKNSTPEELNNIFTSLNEQINNLENSYQYIALALNDYDVYQKKYLGSYNVCQFEKMMDSVKNRFTKAKKARKATEEKSV